LRIILNLVAKVLVQKSAGASCYYGSALSAKELITKELEEVCKEVDFIMTPTAPFPAFKLGEKTADPLAMYLSDIFTVPANIAGCPSISLPSGTMSVDGKDLPLGICLTARRGNDRMLLDAGKIFLQE
jgi:aspartyl-tRNA(Asn)/glutamyl-tRNA(Gln) amidotransferase subunit A